MTYKLISTKGEREVEGTQEEAIAAAIAMDGELQPAYGVTVELDGETVAEIEDGVDTYTDDDNCSAQDDAMGLSLPFCACGRRLTECDGSRAGCSRPNRGGAP